MAEQEQQQEQTATLSPPWGDDFDAEKAWNLVQNLRSDKEKLAARPTLDDDSKRKLAEYERLEQASKSELERKAEEVMRWQSDAERWRSTAVASTVQALAASDFADPTDAVNALDPAKYIDAGGTIDNEAIRSDLAALLERKPHYRRGGDTQPGPRVPAPNRAQGANGTAAADPAEQFAALLQNGLRR